MGGLFIRDEVVGISWDNTFAVTFSKGKLEAKSVIITTGSVRKTVNIEGLAEFEGKGVSYCAVCDAFFYRGREVAVLGSGEYALHEVTELLGIAGHITVLTNGAEPTAAFPEQVSVLTASAVRLEGNPTLERIVLLMMEQLFLQKACLLRLARPVAAIWPKSWDCRLTTRKL